MKKLIILIIFSFVMTSVARAEESPEALTLAQVLRMTYLNHPKMVEARKEISASKGRWIQAEALPDPEIGFDIGGLKKHRKDEGEKEIRDTELGSFSIKQPLDPPGTRFLRGRIAHDEVKISKGNLELVWAEVRKQMIQIYASIVAEERALEIAQSNLNASRQFFTNIETRYQSGNALQSELIRAKMEVSLAESDLLIAEKNFKVSKGEMNLALGRSIETLFILADSLDYEALHYEYQKIMGKALRDRADIRNETTQLSARKKGLWSAVLTTFFPKMTLGIERQTEDFENDTSLLIEASYPLWGFNLGRIKEANAEKEKQGARLENLKRQVSLEVYQAFLEAELADKMVLIKKKSVDEGNELLKQVTLQYAQGKIPFVVYLENIKTIKEARLGYLNALQDCKTKVAELERVIQDTPAPEGIKP